MFRRFTKMLFILAMVSTTLLAQTLTFAPYGVSPRGVAKSTTDIYTNAYNGLTNVGVGTKMYFKASWVGKTYGSPVFKITRAASGSTSKIETGVDVQNDTTQVIAYTPDKVGVYSISVTVGSQTATVAFNAAKYLGYQNAVNNGLICKTCHSDKVAEWEKTGHASMFTRAMNGTPGLSGPTDHYSKACIGCHTTGYDANATAVNDGFDDLPFTYPTVLGAGVYDQLVTAFPDAMKRANIQCESCHGPASGHYGNTTDERMVASWDAKVCAWCHDSGTHHFFPDQWSASKHAVSTNYPTGPGRESCVRCHSSIGFAEFADNVPTTDPYFDASYQPITCAGCHDPHDVTNTFQLRKVTATILKPNTTTPTSPLTADVTNAGMGTMCFNCHQSRAEANAALASTISARFGAHYGPQGDILESSNLLALGGVKLASTNHIGATQDACVRCHMFSVSTVADAQGNIAKVGGHSFNMSYNGYDNMEACAGCHGSTFGTKFSDVKFFLYGGGDLDNDGVVEGLQDEVWGMINKIMAELGKIPGTTFSTEYGQIDKDGKFIAFPVPKSTWTKDQLSAYWNANVAHNDRSGGIHNPKYIVTALKGAMQLLGLKTAVEQETAVPTEYTLYQNYPNPFNPTTNIKFALPKSGHVKLTIYDALGKEVVTLVNNELAAGLHNFEWSARNMASGIYLYRIESGNFVKVNKMLLVK